MSKKTKILKSCMAGIMAFCLVLGCVSNAAVAFAAEGETFHYVSLGASQTNGYGMLGYLPDEVLDGTVSKVEGNAYGYQRKPEGAYPDLVRDTLEDAGYTVKLDQLAISSMRAEELHVLLDDEYEGDAYTEWRFTGGKYNWFNNALPGGLPALREAYQEAVENADLITVDIGVNNFGVYSINRITDPSFASADFEDVFSGEELVEFEANREKVFTVIADLLGEENADTQTAIEHIVNTLAYAVTGFCVNFDAAMERIYELNPDANVVVMSIQNLIHGLYAEVPGLEEPLPLGDLYDLVIDMANTYTAVVSPYCEQYVYANVSEDGRVEYFLDDIMVYDGDLEVGSELWLCFHILDDTLNAKPAIQALFMQQYGSYLGGMSADEFEYLGANGMLDNAQLEMLYEDVYLAALYAGYDMLAQIMKIGANVDTVDLNALLDSEATEEAEELLISAIENDVVGAIVAAISGSEYVLDESKYLDEPAVATVMAMGVRSAIGNSFFAHPNANGHMQLKDAIIDALQNEVYGKEVVTKQALKIAKKLIQFVSENRAEIYDFIKTEGEKAGYIEIEAFEVPEDAFYVAIGDDTAYSYKKGREEVVTYVDYLAEDLAIAHKNLAKQGLIAEDTFAILEENATEIEKADFITLGYGNNGFTNFTVAQLMKQINGEEVVFDWSLYLQGEELEYVETALAELRTSFVDSGMEGEVMGVNMADLLSVALESYAYGFTSYVYSYPKVIEAIQEVNPEAVILVVGMYNPLAGVVLDLEGEKLAIGDYIQYLVDATNMHCSTYTLLTTNTEYVDAPDVETKNTKTEMTILQFLMVEYVRNKGASMNPSENGHQYIKDQILDVLSELEENIPSFTVAVHGAKNGATYTISADSKVLNVVNDTAACVVGYTMDEGETYTRLSATENAEGGFDFDLSSLPAGAAIVIAVKGDMSGDGVIRAGDATQVLKAAGGTQITALQMLVADLDANGKVRAGEATQVLKAAGGAAKLGW